MGKIVDYYQFLGINMDSTDAEVLSACRKILKENNLEEVTDKSSSDYQNRRLMIVATKRIYSILKDHDKRREYDRRFTEYQARVEEERIRREKYLEAYREDSEEVTPTDDYSAPWLDLIHGQGVPEASSGTTAVEQKKGKPIAVMSTIDQEEDYSADAQKMIRSKNITVTSQQQVDIPQEEENKNGVAEDKTTETIESTSTDESTTTNQPQEETTPVISTDSSLQEPVLEPVWWDVSSTMKKQESSIENPTKNRQKETTKLQIVSSQRKTTPKTKDSTSKKTSSKTTKTTGTKGNTPKKKHKSNGILHISQAFARELLKLEVQKNDTPKKYIVRNKTIFGTILAVAVLGGAMSIKNASKNSGKELDILQSTVASTEEPTTQSTLDYTTSPTGETEELEQTITIYRVHRIVPGDILSKFSADSNTTMEEIKKVNNMPNDTVMLGKEYIIPYIIDAEDLHIYTTSAPYNPNMTLEEYAKEYETDPETMCRINPEAIVFEQGTGYRVLTDSLSVPNFVTKDQYREIKAAERNAQKGKNN